MVEVYSTDFVFGRVSVSLFQLGLFAVVCIDGCLCVCFTEFLYML